MLKVSVKSLLTDPSAIIPFQADVTPEPVMMDGEEVLFLGPCRMNGVFKHIGGGVIRYSGTMDTEVRMACSRCMKETDLPLHTQMEQRFTSDRQQESYMDDDIEVYQNDTIDLTELLTAEINLAIPMKVLCKEDCKGLCPICGKDLNEGPCDCQDDNIDPRWDALKSLLQKE